jgi:LiaF transmembrane domain
MDCVNHSGVSAAAYCQHCGKALCSGCVRNAPGGQIFCEPCWTAWQGVPPPFVPPPAGTPHPGLAALLGLIPGVGAMYNGQFVKGLIHVVIFAVLVSAAHVYDVFGLFVAAWIFYQAFEAYHTAKARRDGEPLPDPLGLNEVSSLFSGGGRAQHAPQGVPPGMQGGAGAGTAATEPADANQAQNQPPYQGPYQGPYQSPYQGPYAPPGYAAPGMPPIPPVPPAHWRRREPIGAVILIALGLLLLVGQMDWFTSRLFQFGWPVLLIGLGVWLIVRRLQDTHGNSQGGQK